MAAVLFRLPRTRNPLLRALSALLGVVVVGVTLVFGFFIVLGLAAIGGAIWAARRVGKPAATAETPFQSQQQQPPQAGRPAPAGVIEGEFVVVRETVSPPR
jgi:hypothetical protein